MPIESDYELRYVTDLEDVPIAGPDDYTQEQKMKALFSAESSLELDVNNGEQIIDEELTNSHRNAVMNLATHVLTHAAEDPADATIGDMASGGGTITEYSSTYKDEYERIVAELTESGAGGHGNFSHSVNTR